MKYSRIWHKVLVNETVFFVSFVGYLCHNGGVFRYLLPDTGVNITRNSTDNIVAAKPLAFFPHRPISFDH